jgi:hypothetical protein
MGVAAKLTCFGRQFTPMDFEVCFQGVEALSSPGLSATFKCQLFEPGIQNAGLQQEIHHLLW